MVLRYPKRGLIRTRMRPSGKPPRTICSSVSTSARRSGSGMAATLLYMRSFMSQSSIETSRYRESVMRSPTSNKPEGRSFPSVDVAMAPASCRSTSTASHQRHLEDTFSWSPAHSVGRARQHVDLLGYALMVNGLSLLRR